MTEAIAGIRYYPVLVALLLGYEEREKGKIAAWPELCMYPRYTCIYWHFALER